VFNVTDEASRAVSHLATLTSLTLSSELTFSHPLAMQVPTTLQLSNPTSESVAFKVKTTSPKKYCVRPNTGVVKPGETVDVLIIMQQQKEWPLDLTACKDKFLVQSLILDPRQVANVGTFLFEQQQRDSSAFEFFEHSELLVNPL
jgi:hypothetical protein